jgi:quercetin dioxygenase-like cupin family protein
VKTNRGFFAAALLAILFLFFTTTSQTQDVAKVASDTNRVIFENEQVRVMSVTVKPGQRVPMHSHPASVVYFFHDATMQFTFPDGSTKVGNVKADTAIWMDPVTHAAQNIGTTDFQEVHVELKHPLK